MESSGGQVHANPIREFLCGWGIVDQIIRFCTDTTASNSCKYKDACISSSKMLVVPLLQLYCRRHIWEIHLSHALVGLLGKTKGS